MNKFETQPLFMTLSPEQQSTFREWEGLYRECVNPPEIDEIKTIVVPTGGWLERADMGLHIFKALSHHGYTPQLFITGENGSQVRRQKGDTLGKASNIAKAVRWFGGLTQEEKGRIVVDDTATNTKDQSLITFDAVQSGLITPPLLIVVSDWHLPRNYMTMIKPFILHEGDNLQTRIFCLSADGDMDEATKDTPDQTRLERILGEIPRIHRYQAQGDVATVSELHRYTTWLNAA